ncbi:hypothetical protein HZB94_05005 [Candidatus Falkowbacteria bacterium]|nr:hypothetical protein [Candidatus Falkowbacteria bacterium]
MSEQSRADSKCQSVKVTPFIQRLVENELRTIDFTSFEIVEVLRREFSPRTEERADDWFPLVILKIKICLDVVECGKIILQLEFVRSQRSILFTRTWNKFQVVA